MFIVLKSPCLVDNVHYLRFVAFFFLRTHKYLTCRLKNGVAGEGNVSLGTATVPVWQAGHCVGLGLGPGVNLLDEEDRVSWGTWSLEPASHLVPGPQR